MKTAGRAALLLCLALLSCGRPERNTGLESWTRAGTLLNERVYDGHRRTFYCDCAFTASRRVRCRVGAGERARRVEWEHIVPASRFGRTFDDWEADRSWGCALPEGIRRVFGIRCVTASARSNLRKRSREYRLMESDLYNLVPAVGLINQKRANLPYGEIPGEVRGFGPCDFEVDGERAEPPGRVRGDIARTYLYMARAYPGRVRLLEEELRMFGRWDREDPVDGWECERCRRIEAVQKSRNPVVEDRCRAAGMW